MGQYDAAMTEAPATAPIGWIGLDGPAPVAEIHGEKAALLAVAAGAGLSVPPGFALPPGIDDPTDALTKLEAAVGQRLGCPDAPLLVSARPSAPIGAGGVAPAVLDIGVTEATLPALIDRLGERGARDLYRRLVHEVRDPA